MNSNYTNEEITADLLANLPDTYQKNVGEFAWDFFRSISYSFQAMWQKIKYIYNWKDINNLELEDLIPLVYQLRGIKYRYATASEGELTLTGSGTVNKGDIFKTTAGLEFAATETVVINETGKVKAICQSTGKIGNVPVGQISVFGSRIDGLTTVTNEVAFAGGYEAETKDELYARYIDDITMPIVTGNNNFYKKSALEVSGVGGAKVKPLWNGNNTVKIVIIGNDGKPAGENLVLAVQNYIDPYVLDEDGNKIGWGCGNGVAPIGAYCTVESATAKNLTIELKAKIQNNYTLAEVKNNIQNQINEYLKEIAFKQNFVSYAKIGNYILNAEGLEDYSELKINNGTSNISVSDTSVSSEIAVLQTLNVEEIIQ